ncbi:efflux RND transporter periplasmic adaptor subunit [Aquimarina sp. 2201CG14-23]|uniref:efflux RND transporter periplasmic adaptor subunit n=1 Tax=Aquimarina mycalae TaxID=3040073 RepID=UPI0024780E6F|nr:efflux RND transporter periplasmic adaptor subunit [Aquimarina sp. 2201CG14-23]MDH7447884.1 efflux RND transporter periplasmic adaptor subunit [Aquimarina sp. 2201CG14-23]
MKKNVVYIGIAVLIGLCIGYFIFGNHLEKTSIHEHEQAIDNSDQAWTCSMHPQVIQSEPGDCPICGMDLIPVDVASDGLSVDEFRMTENAIALANIQTSTVGGTDFDTKALKLSGKIKENEKANTVQVTHFAGRIEKLFVNSIGEKVSNGQIIAIIYSPELVAAQQELLTAVALKKTQPALYEAVRNKLKLRKLSEAQINKIESSGEIKETFPVHAHVSGIVSETMVEEGNHIEKGQILLKVTDLRTVWASFDAYEHQISLLKIGQKIKIKTNAYPNQIFDGDISFIDPVLNASTRTVTVRAVLKNYDGLFKPGMFVEGTVTDINGTSKDAIVIPKSAVLWTGKRSIVYVKTASDQSVFEMREVTLGNTEGETYLIQEGLQNGEEIVTNGTFTVDAAAQLQGKKSMMNQALNHDSKTIAEKMIESGVSINFQKELMTILPSYFLLKDALVADDAGTTISLSKKLLTELKSMNIETLKTNEQAKVTKSIKMVEAISQQKNIVDQRRFFVTLNENLIALIKNIENLPNVLYIQECPMADQNRGAIWLSKEVEIRNPYFGSEMLTCGSIVDTLTVK